MVIVDNMMKRESLDNRSYDYYYRIIKGKICLGDNCMSTIQSYGIEVERQDFEKDTLVNVERERIDNISPHRHKVQNILKSLYKGSASPIHLVDIVSETIDDYISDFDEMANNISAY
ncbi:DUF6514 family protein [Clostridium sediminicola]|uniref:DUF6514 family protein n=1 Tax=Clostridium sediminicola TaxID=3114879 RepID=UPI0031F1FFC6